MLFNLGKFKAYAAYAAGKLVFMSPEWSRLIRAQRRGADDID
jgi:hypothetical protein